jgi:hypothetical protein
MPALRLALLLIALLPTAASGAEPDAARARGDLAIRARAVLRKYCAECHGEKPTRAQLSLLDHRQVIAERGHLVRFVTPGEPANSRLLELIEDGAMPPGGRPRPTAEDLATLKAWVTTKTPYYPKAFDDAYVLTAIRDDLARQKWEDAPPFRYLSFAHLVGDGTPDLRAAEQRLRDALLAASGKAIVPQPIDDAATVFRIDLRDTGWLAPDLFERIEKRKGVGVYPIVPFDLLLLEYPYAAVAPPDGPLGPFLTGARQLRPVPFLRADWAAEALRKDDPLAAELLSLAELAAAKNNPGPGPVPRPFAGARPAHGPFLPFGAWYSADVSIDPPPFTLTVEVLDTGGNPLSEVAADGRFKIRLKASTDVSFTVVRVLADGEVRLQAIGDGNRLKAMTERTLLTDTGLPFVAGGILSGAASATEYLVVFATDRDLPDLTLIRSQHTDDPAMNRYPIHRFIPAGKGDKFDPTRVVRKVVPLKVVKPGN